MFRPVPRLARLLPALCLFGSSAWLTAVSAQVSDPFAAGERWSFAPDAKSGPWVPTSVALTGDAQFVWSAPAFGAPRLALHSADELSSAPALVEDAALGPQAVPPIVAAGPDAGFLYALIQAPLAGGSRATRIERRDAFLAFQSGSPAPLWTRSAPYATDAPGFLGATTDRVVWAGWNPSAGVNRIEWLDAATGAVIAGVGAGTSRVRTFAVADGGRVALTTATHVIVADPSGVLFEAGLSFATNALAFAGDGRSVLVGDAGGARRFVEGAGGFGPAAFVPAAPGEIATRAALSADGSIQAIAWWDALGGDAVRVAWSDTVSGAALGTFAQSGTQGGVQNFPARIELTPDGRRLALALWGAGDARPEVALIDTLSGATVVAADLGLGSALAVAVSADGTRVVAGTKDVHANTFGSYGAVRLFDTGERDLQVVAAPLSGAPLELSARRPGASAVLFLVGPLAASPKPYPQLGGTLHLQRSAGLAVFALPADPSGRADLTLPASQIAPGSGTTLGAQALFRVPGASQLSQSFVVPAFL